MTLTRPTLRSPQVQRMQPEERLHEEELELDDEEEHSSISCGGADEVAWNTHLCCHSQRLQTAMFKLRTSLPILVLWCVLSVCIAPGLTGKQPGSEGPLQRHFLLDLLLSSNSKLTPYRRRGLPSPSQGTNGPWDPLPPGARPFVLSQLGPSSCFIDHLCFFFWWREGPPTLGNHVPSRTARLPSTATCWTPLRAASSPCDGPYPGTLSSPASLPDFCAVATRSPVRHDPEAVVDGLLISTVSFTLREVSPFVCLTLF